MSFSDRMKEILGQSVTASKGLASKAGEKAQDLGGKGFKASKGFLNKAGKKAQDLGEKGVLKLEIKQLEGQAQKQMTRLGYEVYSHLVEKNGDAISMDTPEIKVILGEISLLREGIEKREADLQNRKQAES